MTTATETVVKIEPVAAAFRDIAFEANILAVNAAIEAACDGGQGRRGAADRFATEIRSLAERAAEAAKEISQLSRQSAEATQRAGLAIDKTAAELAVVGRNLNTLESDLDMIAASSSDAIEKAAAVRMSILALAKDGGEMDAKLDALDARIDRIMREIGAIDHNSGRFTRVTVLTQAGMITPRTSTPVKRGAYLRLVK
jgi:methyl-accepting chemotaxis protein